ncbi:MAG: ECF transporter S component [Candidatus Bipolaricaulaceae bacterium]
MSDRAPAAAGLGRFGVRDIVLVALLASVGGALSAYIGYLGNLVNRFFGVPFGAGQMLAGLHVVWPLLAAALVRRVGAATLTGLVKGTVEFLMGGTHGVVILLVSAVEGAFVDVGTSLDPRRPPWTLVLSGAVASSSNVFIFQALYFSGVPWDYILFMGGLAAISGAVLGGWLSCDLVRLLRRAGLAPAPTVRGSRLRAGLAGGVAVAMLAGGVYYYLDVYQPPLGPGTLRVEGQVERPFLFQYEHWEGREVTIRATLQGAVTYVPERPYTGVPVSQLLVHAQPLPGASQLVARARDGYRAAFTLEEAMTGSALLVVQDRQDLRLVAKDHSGSEWVQDLVTLEVK